MIWWRKSLCARMCGMNMCKVLWKKYVRRLRRPVSRQRFRDVQEKDRQAMYRALSVISKNLEKISQNKEKQL